MRHVCMVPHPATPLERERERLVVGLNCCRWFYVAYLCIDCAIVYATVSIHVTCM